MDSFFLWRIHMIPLVSFLLLGGSHDLLATRSVFFCFFFVSLPVNKMPNLVNRFY
jgi:hypothetical protein